MFSTFSNAIKDRTNDLKVVYQNLINIQGNMSWLSHKNGKTSSNFTQTLNLFILNTFKLRHARNKIAIYLLVQTEKL